MTDTSTRRETGTTAGSHESALLGELQAAHAEGRKLVDELTAALADCDDQLAEVTAVLRAVVRHSGAAVAIVDADLDVHAASPAAVELMAAHGAPAATPSGRRSLQPVLPPGGTSAVRRCLVAEAGGDIPAPDEESDAADVRPPAVQLRAGFGEVTVERVCARRRPLGGLWGGWVPEGRRGSLRPGTVSPRFPYGLVTFSPAPRVGDDT